MLSTGYGPDRVGADVAASGSTAVHKSRISTRFDDIVMFDVPPPTALRGIAAYRGSWIPFLGWLKDLGVFELTEFHVVAGDDVAFGYGILRCGAREPGVSDFDVRLSVGLRKTDGRWIVLHEHHSVPAAS